MKKSTKKVKDPKEGTKADKMEDMKIDKKEKRFPDKKKAKGKRY